VATFKQVKGELSGLLGVLKKGKNQIQTAACNEVESRIANRVFVRGLATDRRQIGKYKDGPYKKLRQKEGRQTSKVDLEMTGSLRRSLVVGTSGGNVVLGFNRAEEATIAAKNEERYKKDIFAPSKTEVRAGNLAVTREIDYIVKTQLQ